MSDNPEDFLPDDYYNYAICASCEEAVEKASGFYDEKEGLWYHLECADVWRCVNCGRFNPNELLICNCGQGKEG